MSRRARLTVNKQVAPGILARWELFILDLIVLGDGYRCAQPFCVVGIFPRACPFPALGEQRQARHHAAMRYWWVNQNQTYRHEVPGGYLWSPKRNRNGGRSEEHTS